MLRGRTPCLLLLLALASVTASLAADISSCPAGEPSCGANELSEEVDAAAQAADRTLQGVKEDAPDDADEAAVQADIATDEAGRTMKSMTDEILDAAARVAAQAGISDEERANQKLHGLKQDTYDATAKAHEKAKPHAEKASRMAQDASKATADATAGAYEAAKPHAEKAGLSMKSMTDTALDSARNMVCGAAKKGTSEITTIKTGLPRCQIGCRFKRIIGVRANQGHCKGPPGSRKIYTCGKKLMDHVRETGTKAAEAGKNIQTGTAKKTPPPKGSTQEQIEKATAGAKESLDKATIGAKKQTAGFLEWTGLCETPEPADGVVVTYEIVYESFPVDYETGDSEKYVDYYGDDDPIEEFPEEVVAAAEAATDEAAEL